MRRLLLATRSAGKLRELRPMFARAGFDALDLDEAGLDETEEEELIEQFETFEENAVAKARYFHARSGGRPTVADDSGLEVAALGGRPGVRSKRWSGRTDLSGPALDAANNALLLRELAGAPDRRARYVCAAALVDGEHTLVRSGTVEGVILEAPEGGGGFGYDPYFRPLEASHGFGRLSREAKEGISHRGRAFAALLAALSGLGDSPPGSTRPVGPLG